MGAQQSSENSTNHHQSNSISDRTAIVDRIKFTQLQFIKINFLHEEFRLSVGDPIFPLLDSLTTENPADVLAILIHLTFSCFQRLLSPSTAPNQLMLDRGVETLFLLVSVFVKNTSSSELAQTLDRKSFDPNNPNTLGSLLSESLASIIIKAEQVGFSKPSLESIQLSALVLFSSNLLIKHDSLPPRSSRRFLEIFKSSLEPPVKAKLIQAILTIIANSSLKSVSIIASLFGNREVADNSRISMLLFVSLFFPESDFSLRVKDESNNSDSFIIALNELDDCELFNSILNYFIHTINLENYSSIQESVLIQSLLFNFCTNYRIFVLSKLDCGEFVLSLLKILYSSCKSRLGGINFRSQRFIQHAIGQILFQSSQDLGFLKQLFNIKLENKNLLYWFSGELDANKSIGLVAFEILLQVIEFNLFCEDFEHKKDRIIHELCCSTLMNISFLIRDLPSQVCNIIFDSILSNLLRLESKEPNEEAEKCLISILTLVANILLNNPRNNVILVYYLLYYFKDVEQFLTRYLSSLDSAIDVNQMSGSIQTESLEIISNVDGILRAFNRINNFLVSKAATLDSLSSEPGAEQIMVILSAALNGFDLPGPRRDSSGDLKIPGVRCTVSIDNGLIGWSEWCGLIGWSLVYSMIPWPKFLN